MADPLTIERLRVRALQPSFRRAGMAFTKEPSDLTRESFAPGLAGLMQFAALLADPILSVVAVTEVDGAEVEQPITDEMRDELTAVLEAETTAAARVDPDKPPAVTLDDGSASADPAKPNKRQK